MMKFRMRILGKYPKGYGGSMRVNVSILKCYDQIVIEFDTYTILEVSSFPCEKIRLDRLLDRATNFHEPIVYKTPYNPEPTI